MKFIKLLSLIVILFATSCTKKDQIIEQPPTVEVEAEFKVSFSVEESLQVNQYVVYFSDKAEGEEKQGAIIWPDTSKVENTYSVSVPYKGSAKVLYFRVIALNIDGSSHSTAKQTIRL